MVRCSCVRSCVCYPRFIQLALGSCYDVHIKRIVNIMKVYIERNKIQVELIRFLKTATLLSLETVKWENFRDRRVY